MLIHLPGTRDRIGLVKNLIELFRQIDVNNDQSLEWDEFTGHIIELGKFSFLDIFDLILLQVWLQRIELL